MLAWNLPSVRRLVSAAMVVLLPSAILPAALPAQTSALASGAQVASRLTQPINEAQRATLHGTVHPLANAANDRGAAADDLALDRIQIVLKRSDAQETALKQLIADMHTPGTTSYHKWLTPVQFGQQFGPSDADIATVQNWLSSHGFGSATVNPGKQTLEVSGSVAQFRDAFHTQIHRYQVNGETHYANATDPQIPAALAPVFGGFASLNNFRVKRMSRTLGRAAYDTTTHKTTPQWTVSSGTTDSYALSPGDFAVQYDLNPLYAAGTTGTGQTIAVVNDSNVNLTLVNNFRTLFGLTSNPPQVIIDGNDPGIDGINNPDGPNYDSIEAYLDVEWSGAVAPNAQIDLVIGADTALESGLILAAEHAVNGNIAPVISLSFGSCEEGLAGSNAFLSALWEQAAAQGITVSVSTGDSGSAGCDNDNTQEFAVSGQAVSGYASTPYNVAVGGTDFNYTGSTPAAYWNQTATNSTPTISLQSVAPEQPWNDSQYGLNLNSNYALYGTTTIAAGSGGASTCGIVTGTTCAPYPKPSWQTGTGVPADSARDLPDVSLFAADGSSNNTFFPICAYDGDCEPVTSPTAVQFTAVGGTSASAPSFAGIMALVNQKYGPQGQADFVLYPLAAQFPTAFHDVTAGSNAVPCNINDVSFDGTVYVPVNCLAVSSPITVTDPTFGTSAEGELGNTTTKVADYNAAAGYDLATGLGTIDANVLVTDWNKVSFKAAAVTLTPSSTNFTHGTSITISGAVTGSTTPTGSVALVTTSTEPLQQGQGVFPLTGGAYSGSLNTLPGGTYNVYGRYSGDGTNAAATSGMTQITVAPEASTLYFNLLNTAVTTTGAVAVNPNGSVTYGTQLVLDGEVIPTTYYNKCVNVPTQPASCSTTYYTNPTGSVTFSDSSNRLGTAAINAEGDAELNYGFAVGSHSVTANFAGDNSYNSSTGTAIPFTVTKATPAFSFSNPSSSSTSYPSGEPSILTVQLENVSNYTLVFIDGVGAYSPVAAPTGTVTVTGLPGGAQTLTLGPSLDLSTTFPTGVSSLTLPATLPVGNYTLTFTYSGDSNYLAASGSDPVAITAAAAGLATTTTATQSALSTSVTAGVNLTATVSSTAAPTGSVEFTIPTAGNSPAYAVIGRVALTAASATTSTATLQVDSASLQPGVNAITVLYLGTTGFQPSATVVDVSSGTAPGTNTFTLTAPQVSIAAPGSTGTATVTATPYGSFTGTVALTCAVSGGAAGSASGITCPASTTATISTAGVAATGSFTINTTGATVPGTYTVIVTGTSGGITQTVNVVVTVGGTIGFSLSGTPVTPTSIAAGASATSTLSITPAGGFTGAVALSCAVYPSTYTDTPTCSLSSPATVSGTTAVTETLTLNTQAGTTGGTYNVIVKGASGILSATTGVSLTVTGTTSIPAFALAAPAITISSPGGSGTSTVTITPSGGFTGTIALTCSVSPTTETDTPGCSLSTPAAITGTTAVTATLTVTTTAATAALGPHPLDRVLGVGGGVAMAALLFFVTPVRRRRWKTLLMLLVFAAIAGSAIGCGSSTATAGSGGGNTGTTTGNYTVTVTGTATGASSQFTSVTVTVN